MATFAIDPATVNLADFSPKIEFDESALSIVDDGGVPAIRAVRATGTGNHFTAYDPAGVVTDAQIVTKARHSANATSGNYALSVARMDSSFDLYGGGVRGAQSNTIISYVNGSVSGLASIDIGIDATVYAWQRFEVTGSTVRIRRWTGTPADEPATWDSEVTNTDVTAAGYVGIGARNNGTDPSYYAFIGIGTDGDTAPTSVTATPTITDINTNNEVVPGTTATLTGTNLTGATGFNIGAEAQTDFTVVSDTSITFTTVRGGNPYNQNLTGTLLHPDGNQTITVQQVPAADELAVTADNPNNTDEASFWANVIDTETGDPVTIVNGDSALAYDFAALEGENVSFNIEPRGNITAEFTGTFKAILRLASDGTWGDEQTVSYTVTATAAPQGTITIGTITRDDTTASVPFTYDDTDESGFEYSLDAGTWTSTTSPIVLEGLTEQTEYSIAIRAVNSEGPGTEATTTFTTEATPVEPQPPQSTPVIGQITVGTNSASIPFTYPGDDATNFEHSTDAGETWTAVNSPISRTGLTASTGYTGQVRAVNGNGAGAAANYSFTTDSGETTPPTPEPQNPGSTRSILRVSLRRPTRRSLRGL